MAATPLIELDAIAVQIGGTPVLRDLSVRVERGEIIGLYGPNGSGKTTLLRVLATLLPPSAGTATVLGADLNSDERFALRPRIAFIGHEPSLYPDLTIEENTALVARLMGLPEERVYECLDVVGLAAARTRKASQCSHGMQRRAEFARVLLTDPDLLLLDEAHAGLDPQAADLVTLLAKNAAAGDGGALLVSHDPARLGALVARSYRLNGGKLEPDGAAP